MKTFKVLGALLTYPEDELIEALDELEAVLASEGLLGRPERLGLAYLIDHLRKGDLLELQESYIGLFDRSRALSLHLYEHVHGESRDRGQAMASLMELYRFHGMQPSAHELPDYLPMLCEFLSVIEPRVAKSIVADAAHVLEAIRVRLEDRGSPYAAAFAALVALAEADIDRAQVLAVLEAEPDAETSFEALDREWEEAAVSFGPGSAAEGCPSTARARPAAGM